MDTPPRGNSLWRRNAYDFADSYCSGADHAGTFRCQLSPVRRRSPPATTVADGATTASNAVAPDGAAGGQGLFAGQDFQFTTMDGQMRKLSEFAGKPVVLNYFGMG